MDDLGVPHGTPILGKLQIGEITRNQSDPVPHVWVMLKWLRTKATQFPLWQVPLSDAQGLDIFMRDPMIQHVDEHLPGMFTMLPAFWPIPDLENFDTQCSVIFTLSWPRWKAWWRNTAKASVAELRRGLLDLGVQICPRLRAIQIIPDPTQRVCPKWIELGSKSTGQTSYYPLIRLPFWRYPQFQTRTIVEYAYFWKSMPAILFCLLSLSDCHGIEVLVGEDGSVEWEEPSEHVQWEGTDTPTLLAASSWIPLGSLVSEL